MGDVTGSRGHQAILWLAGLVLLAWTNTGCQPMTSGQLEIGGPVPAFNLKQLGGGRLSSDQLAGNGPVVINFWATWCGPCRREIPSLVKLHDKQTATVIGISLDHEGKTVVAPFAERNNMNYPVLFGDTQLFQRFGGSAIPFTVVLDEELRVHKVFRGLVSMRSLERSLEKLDDVG